MGSILGNCTRANKERRHIIALLHSNRELKRLCGLEARADVASLWERRWHAPSDGALHCNSSSDLIRANACCLGTSSPLSSDVTFRTCKSTFGGSPSSEFEFRIGIRLALPTWTLAFTGARR